MRDINPHQKVAIQTWLITTAVAVILHEIKQLIIKLIISWRV